MWARLCCLMLLMVAAALAAAFACAKTGKRMAARIAMIAMTTKSSMSVKPDLDFANESLPGSFGEILSWLIQLTYTTIARRFEGCVRFIVNENAQNREILGVF